MRVLLVSKALVVGAYQRKAEEIARCGVDLTVIVPPYWQDARGRQTAEALHVDGYELVVAPVRFNGQFHFHYYPTLARELDRIQPDVLHMDEEPYNFATWHGLRVATRRNIPATFFTWQNINRGYPPPFRWMEQANYRRAPIAIAGNEEAASVLRAKGYSGEIEVIPQFGVDPETFTPQTKKPGFLEKPGFCVGYAGGLLPEKGLDTLLQACVRLEPGWRLLLAGEGSEEAALRQLAAELDMTPSVEFVGRVPSERMAEFYHRLDAFVLPSRTTPSWKEQFGRVLIEAMACGVPVIGSDSGEIPNVIDNTGQVFPEGRVAELAQRLTWLQNESPERERLARVGRERVLAHYTMRSIAERTVQIYERLML